MHHKKILLDSVSLHEENISMNHKIMPPNPVRLSNGMKSRDIKNGKQDDQILALRCHSTEMTSELDHPAVLVAVVVFHWPL
jgi:hypothetical protein